MIIHSDYSKPRSITEFDITFNNGLFFTIPVDEQSGDLVDYDTSPLVTIFHLAEKPSPTDPGAILPAEDISVFLSHVIMINRHTRTLLQPTTDQREELKKAIHSIASSAKSVH